MKKLRLILMLFVGIMLLTGCNKWDDQPELVIYAWKAPTGEGGVSIYNINGRYVVGKHINGTAPDSIVTKKYDDYRRYIRAVVVSSDEGGNFYKSMVIQDETGGVALQLDMTGLHTIYPIGQKIVLVCNPLNYPSLMIGDYHNLPQIGWIYQGGIGRINSLFIDKYIIKDTMPSLKYLPKPLTNNEIDFLGDKDLNKLVRLEGVTFEPEAIGKPLSFNDFTTDWKIEVPRANDDMQSVTVRTSNYAKFRSTIIQNKEYNLTGILTKYNNIYQLMIRVKSDIAESSKEILEFDFASDPLLDGWSIESVLGSTKWIYRNQEAAMMHSSNQSGIYATAMDDWFISPVISYDDVANGYLRFVHQLNVVIPNDVYQVYYTTSTATTFNPADWKPLGTLTSFPASYDWSNPFPLKNINAKKFRIAFRYNAPNPAIQTYLWSIKKVEIRNN